MTLQLIDGFDHYTSSGDMLLKWDTVSGPTISSTHVRGNGAGSAAVVTSNTHYARKMGLGAHSTYVIGAAYYITQMPVDWNLCTFWETTSQAQIVVRLQASGTSVIAYRGNESVSLGTAAAAMPSLNTWYVMEAKAVIHGSTGSVTVKVNGTQVLNVTGVNTQGGATSNINGVGFGSPFPGAGTFTALYIDDFYALNGSGTSNNDFLGPLRVATLRPSAAGAYTQFTPTGASDNYACVNEAAEDGDTSYVAANAVNLIDSYTVPDLPISTTSVAGVQINVIARKDDVGLRAVSPTQRNAGADGVGTSSGDLLQTYTNSRSIYDNSIITGSAWTKSEINSSEFGVKLTS